MGDCSRALFLHLADDLSRTLHTVPYFSLADSSVKLEAWPGITVREYAALALRNSILKKYQGAKSSNADNLALTKFLDANAKCNRAEAINTENLTEIESIALGEMEVVLQDFFLPPELNRSILNVHDVCARIAVGPGASVGASGDSFYHKIASSLLTTTSKSLFELYKLETSKYPLWAETEMIRSSLYGDFRVVQGNKLSYVPKTSEISRTICTEPLLNMMFQKGIASVFESWLVRRFGIDLSIQPDKNRRLAFIGSQSGKFGTIDLSSASDSIALVLLEKLLPKTTMFWLKLTRSPSVTLPDGGVVPLHMVSSMGNAFTFPLQTILFASVVIGVYRALHLEIQYPRGDNIGNFAVFGDDIIVRREAYNLVVKLLERIGFSVNVDKSFNDGPFRESCGSDFLSGVDVRGVYCQNLDTMQDKYSLINRLNIWSSNHGIPLTETIGFLTSQVKFLPVPLWESDVSGIKVPWSLASENATRIPRYSGSIGYSRYVPKQRGPSLVAIGERPSLGSLVGRVFPSQQRDPGLPELPRSAEKTISWTLRNLWGACDGVRDRRYTLSGSNVRKRKSKKEVHQVDFSNAPGVFLTAVAGYLRNGRLLIRQKDVSYQKRTAVCPAGCWDHDNVSLSKLTREGWYRWVTTYTALNLGRL